MLIKRQKMYFELLFKDYYQYPKMIAIRRAELAVREVDENVGGGKSNIRSKPVENLAVRNLNDGYLQFLEKVQQAITDALATLNENERKVIDLWFFDNKGLNTWEYVSEQTHYSKSRIYQIRDTVLEDFANLVGFCNTKEV